MSRLIDANKLTSCIRDWQNTIRETYGINDEYYECLENVIDTYIDNSPTVDAVPVVHGGWEWFEEISYGNTEHYTEVEDYGWRCSSCKTRPAEDIFGELDDPDERPNIKFCPNCGAKMDGKVKEDRLIDADALIANITDLAVNHAKKKVGIMIAYDAELASTGMKSKTLNQRKN